MRKENTKRSFASWVLLAVFVPMLLFSSLHLHQDEQLTEAACAECVDHHCAGHLGQTTVSFHPCVLCQFLSLPFLALTVATLFIYNKVCTTVYEALQCRHRVALPGAIGLRAPPVGCLL